MQRGLSPFNKFISSVARAVGSLWKRGGSAVVDVAAEQVRANDDDALA